MIVEFTELAQQDVRDVLRQTNDQFGSRQLRRYAALFDTAQALLGEDAERPGSLDRSDLLPGIRLFHLELAAGKTGAASHCLYYQVGTLSDGTQGVIVLRVLHQRMEPTPHLAKALQQG